MTEHFIVLIGYSDMLRSTSGFTIPDTKKDLLQVGLVESDRSLTNETLHAKP